MDTLSVPPAGSIRNGGTNGLTNGAVEKKEEFAIIVQNSDDEVIDELKVEDVVLDDEDEEYNELIREFRSKMDSLSFKRLDKTELKAKAASIRAAKKETLKINKRKTANARSPRKEKTVKMLPAVRFQELDGDESNFNDQATESPDYESFLSKRYYISYRRDTGSSSGRRDTGNSYGRRDTGSSYDRSRTSSAASTAAKGPSARRFNAKSTMGRKKSVMGAIMKRGRTMRKTLRAMHINEADGGSGEEGSHGAPPTNEQRLRMFVLKEIFDTETEYMKLLEFMVEVMAPSIQRLAEDTTRAHSCTKETASQILSNVREIHSLHVLFHKAMEEILTPAPFHTHCIGKVFLKFKNEFKVYDQYCANFSRAQKICYELEKDPDFNQLIEEWKESVESKSRRFLHLEGFIISPVQRLCKYPLFLKELNKHTPSSHNDSKDVLQARKVMEDVTKSVNESERRQLMVQAIRDMENLCDTWEQSGFVSKQGFLTKRGGSVKSWYIRWFLLKGYELAYYNEPTDVHPLGILDLTSYKSLETDVSAHVGRPYSFGIKMPDRVYYMYAVSEVEKDEWISILQWKFDCIERTRRQAHHPFETVVFSSLSSFLHPKSKRSEADELSETSQETNGETINMGNRIMQPLGPDQDEVFQNNSDSSGDSPKAGEMKRSQSLSDVLEATSSEKSRAPSTRSVTVTIEKSSAKNKKFKFIPASLKSRKSTNST